MLEFLAVSVLHFPASRFSTDVYRNQKPNYLNTNYFRFLKDLDLSNVFLQGYFMPPVVGIYNKYKEYITGQSIIRLHGPDIAYRQRIISIISRKIYQSKPFGY